MAIGDQILNNWFNGFYFMTMTLSTVAYGDIIPFSWYGKIISMSLAFYGSFVVSLFIVVTQNVMRFDKVQKQAFHKLLISEKAASAIQATWRYYKELQTNKVTHGIFSGNSLATLG
jgi:hypothetical protein